MGAEYNMIFGGNLLHDAMNTDKKSILSRYFHITQQEILGTCLRGNFCWNSDRNSVASKFQAKEQDRT